MSIAVLGNGRLHRGGGRAARRDCGSQARIVSFEEPRTAEAVAHLERLLTAVWCIDTRGWCERGFIYNIPKSAI